jgi:TonB family protein
VSLLAQTNAPPGEPKAPAASQVEEAAKKHASQQGSSEPTGILTDTMGVDFKPYLSRVLRDVRQNWCSLIPEAARPPQVKRGKVVLEFAILKDGSVAGLRVVGTSGDIALDRPAYGSITGSNPFPPLPAEFKGPYLGLRLSFYYNLHPDEANQDVGLSCPSDYVSNEMAKATKAPEAQPSSDTPGLMEAGTLYRSGNLDEAAKKYQHLLDKQPKSAEAYAGLARVYLKQKKVQQAHDTILKGLAVADSARIHVALGEVLFREGKIPEAEREWLNVVSAGQADARVHLGLARVSAAATQYRQAKKEIDEAHRLDPDDPDIQFYWIRSQGLGAELSDSRHDCRLATDLVPTETDLLLLGGDRPNQIRGYGLPVVVNGQTSKLLLDTGAHGITIDRKVAQKAGLTRLSDTTLGGFGDQGKSNGYVAIASSIKVGALEFQDCLVVVVDKRSVLGEDGFIGADVFQEFLIDLDFPTKKLRLGKLPKRLGEDSALGSQRRDARELDSSESNPLSKKSDTNAVSITRDTGVPPYTSVTKRVSPAEFSFSLTPVFRFGHMLLIPTEVGDTPATRLFLIDTGSLRNMFSVNVVREITKVQGNPRMAVRGLGGSVNKVYGAEKTALYFDHVQQYAENQIALDLGSISEDIGTEVSGVLGVFDFRTLDVTIDYRDGLVGFDFKTNP